MNTRLYYWCGVALVLALFSAARLGRAQGLSQSFAGSLVVLRSGDTLRGPLMYLPAEDVIILIRPDQRRETFAPAAVRSFVVRGEVTNALLEKPTLSRVGPNQGSAGDQALPTNLLGRMVAQGKPRVFIAARWPVQEQRRYRQAAGFFEILAPGNVMLLQRSLAGVTHNNVEQYERVRRLPNGNDPYVSTPDYWKPVSRQYIYRWRPKLYLSLPSGALHLLRNPRRQLRAYFPAHRTRLEQYMRQNRLAWNTPAGVQSAVTYLNTLP